MKDHVKVITDNTSMLVRSLSANTAVLNSILDTLHAKGVMPRATYEERLIQDGASPAKRSHRVREFLKWLKYSSNTEPFMVFYDALNEHGLQSDLKILQSHPQFRDEDKSEVSTYTSMSVQYSCNYDPYK